MVETRFRGWLAMRLSIALLFPGSCAWAVPATIVATLGTWNFTVAGTGCQPGSYTSPRTLDWTPGSSCTVSFASPQSTSPGTRYVFIRWQDGPAEATRVITAPSGPMTWTGEFATEFFLTTRSFPAGAGTVTGGGWIFSGSRVTVSATPAAGYRYIDWLDVDSDPRAASATVLMSSPRTVTATFTLESNAVQTSWSMTQLPEPHDFNSGPAVNDFGQVAFAGASPQTAGNVYLWTPSSPNGTLGVLSLLLAAPTTTGSVSVRGINARGQVLINQGSTALLWSPSSANGAQGTVATITATGAGAALNDYGQVAGSGYLWTPATPNGATGTLVTDDRFLWAVAMNNFGQILMTRLGYISLFTPSVRNGSTGTVKAVELPIGAGQSEGIGINSDGWVVGSCRLSSDQGEQRMFLWKPVTPNGAPPGTPTAIPLVDGIPYTYPLAINDRGEVAGSLRTNWSEGYAIPFLYTGGKVYDLTSISGTLRGAAVRSLNNRGQLLLSGNGTLLLTPAERTPDPPANAVPVTFTAPGSPSFVVSGTGCQPGSWTVPRTLRWTPGASCTVTFPQTWSASDSRYIFAGWQNGPTAASRVIPAPASEASYVVQATQEFLVVPVASPMQSGTVSGGGWFPAGASLSLSATPAPGYRFSGWVNADNDGSSATTAVFVFSSRRVVATFTPVGSVPLSSYALTPLSWVAPLNPPVLNDYGQVAGANNGPEVFLWTPAAPNAAVGSPDWIRGPGVDPLSLGGLNNRGQVSFNQGNRALLWSPPVANGRQGTLSIVDPANPAYGMNDYGQVVGLNYIWTPSQANGTSGTKIPLPGYGYGALMNAFGQVWFRSSSETLLFTPSARNSSAGAFTPLNLGTGLVTPGAINAGGVLAASLEDYSTGSLVSKLLIWKPSSPNTATGSVTSITLPTGFSSVRPMSMNDAGEVVGALLAANGSDATPFLYSGGAFQDLTAVSVQIRGGTATGINNKGQIVVVAGNKAFLLTPPGPQPEAPPANAVPVTFDGGAPETPFTVSGAGCQPGAYALPQTLKWTPGASCTVALPSVGGTNVTSYRYTFSGWQDGVASSTRVIPTPAQPTTFTVLFRIQAYVNLVSLPESGGTVSGGGWYDIGSMATVTATPAPGYRFVDWTGLSEPIRSASLTVSAGNHNMVATFAPLSDTVSPSLTMTRFASAYPSGKPAINDYGQILASIYSGNGFGNYLWTPTRANGTAGNTATLESLFGTQSAVVAGINNYGQVSAGGYTQPMLWTPSTPNGTQGSVAQPGAGYRADAIGSYGQLAGDGFLWTPSTANGSTGTLYANTQFQGVAAVNSYGQVLGRQGNAVLVFTPSTRNGTSGTFNTLAGLPSPGSGFNLAGINSSGTVAGSGEQMFVWTPASPNASTGQVTVVPPPPGVEGLGPHAMNDAGDIVGTMRYAGRTFGSPFLYRNGTVHDLSGVSGLLRNGYAMGINNKGQIVVWANSDLYLLTPTALASTTEATVTISSFPPGIPFQADGVSRTTPATFQWVPASTHRIVFPATATLSAGRRDNFTLWADGQTSLSRDISAPAAGASSEFQVSYATQFRLQAAATPASGGSVAATPLALDGYYTSGTSVRLIATPAAGFVFSGFTGDLTLASPLADIPMTRAWNFTANFAPVGSGGCTLSAPATLAIPQEGFQGAQRSIALTASSPACGWTAVSDVPWAQVFPPSGTGSAAIQFTVYPNNSTQARVATIRFGPVSTRLEQAASARIYDERFITQMYFMFLGRYPAATEVAFHLNEGLRKGLAPADLAMNFMNSAEFNDAGRFVAGLYVGLLDRNAEYDGWLFQRNALATGIATRNQLVTNFLGSDEYRLKFGSPTDREFVTLLYRKVIGRDPAAAELTQQVTFLSAGVTRVQMAASFLLSQEFRQNSGSRLNAFLLYATLLQRDPGPGDLDLRIGQLNSGRSVRALIGDFLASPEFTQLLQ